MDVFLFHSKCCKCTSSFLSSKRSQILFLLPVWLFPDRGVFSNSSCKDFLRPLVLSRLPTFHPCSYNSGLRCWILLTSEVKGDLYFPSPPWFRDSSRYTKASWPEQFSELQTGDRLQRTCNIPHDYAEMRQSALTIMCLRILFFWNMLTFYHCVDFSETTTKMQGLCLCS